MRTGLDWLHLDGDAEHFDQTSQLQAFMQGLYPGFLRNLTGNISTSSSIHPPVYSYIELYTERESYILSHLIHQYRHGEAEALVFCRDT